jgi:hypothetical protein
MLPTPEMVEGTIAHKLIETCLNGGHDPQDFVGRFVDKVEVTPDMTEAVQEFVDDVRADKERGATIFVEYAFSLADFDVECWGTCDAVSYFPDIGLLRVRDYKHGAGVFVDVRDNPQLKTYGLGAMMAIGKPVKRVELCIYQPNHYGGEPAWAWEIEPGELYEFSGDLLDAIDAARKPDAPLNPGDHCRTSFCPARAICPALLDIAVKTTGTDIIPFTGDVLVPDVPKTMSADDLGDRLKMAGLIQTWLNAFKALALAEMHRGNVATGFKPVQASTRRRWKDPELITRQAPRVFVGEIAEDDMFTRRIVSPAQFEKLVGKKAAEEFVSAYAEKPKALTLVPVSDKREAVPVGALAEFEPIGDFENVES